jgi:hypothetical protein
VLVTIETNQNHTFNLDDDRYRAFDYIPSNVFFSLNSLHLAL